MINYHYSQGHEDGSAQTRSQPLTVIGNYSSLNDKAKKVKPPALPPKTYLKDGEQEEEDGGQSLTSSAEDVQKPDYENCSVGTDSLYDMEQDNNEDLALKLSEGNDPGEETPSVKTAEGNSQKNLTSHYQKLNVKAMNNPSDYEDLNTAKSQRDTFRSLTTREQLGMARPAGGQYEPLQLQSMERPGEYRKILTAEAPP